MANESAIPSHLRRHRTLTEAGLRGFDVLAWFGLVAPAGTPADRLGYLSTQLAAVLKQPEVVASLQAAGFAVEGPAPALLTKRISDDMAHWKTVIQSANIKLD